MAVFVVFPKETVPLAAVVGEPKELPPPPTVPRLAMMVLPLFMSTGPSNVLAVLVSDSVPACDLVKPAPDAVLEMSAEIKRSPAALVTGSAPRDRLPLTVLPSGLFALL